MGTFLVRIVLLRTFAVVLATAFLVAWDQWPGLLSDDGLTPVNAFLDRANADRRKLRHGEGFSVSCTVGHLLEDWGAPDEVVTPFKGSAAPRRCLALGTFKQVPSVLWFVPREHVDAAARGMAGAGVAIATLVFVTGACVAPVMLLLWVFYLSLITVGQDWYGFGWESQLCETAFIVAWWAWRSVPSRGIPIITTVLVRWLMIRIMVGAGLIKLRGDQCWRDFTCMNYHYHTQPVPNPLVGMLHAMPKEWHAFEVLVNHFVECAAPFYLLLPQLGAAIGAAIQIGFQLVLITSGNLSFLNWLTLVPAIAALDDRYLRWMFTTSTLSVVDRVAEAEASAPRWPTLSRAVGFVHRQTVQVALLCLISYLSWPVVGNLLSQQQAMNTNFDWLRLVNTYGNFGGVTKERNEVVVEGQTPDGKWLTYEFNCKPTDIDRRPCVITPYHYRLDWLMWFAAFSDGRRTGWLLQLANTMLRAAEEPAAHRTLESLVASVPFAHPNATVAAERKDSRPAGPVAIRMTLWEYETNEAGRGGGRPMKGKSVQIGKWWRRRKVSREYLPTIRAGQLENVAEFYRVNPPSP